MLWLIGNAVGMAMTDIAARVRPDLPAVLQSSELGKPVYERMGFTSVEDSYPMWFMAKIGPADA